MPIFFQQDIDETTRLAIWRIDEEESFFLQHVPLQRDITHPHKRLQHLAGRYLLQYLFPDFPISLIKIADTRKPFLENEAYHFSISHCSDYAAAIVSKTNRVGVDIEVPSQKVEKIRHKFLSEEEDNWHLAIGNQHPPGHNEPEGAVSLSIYQPINLLTLLWSAKEAMFKWWGLGDIDFRTMLQVNALDQTQYFQLEGTFSKEKFWVSFPVLWKSFPGLLLAYVVTLPDGQTVSAASAKPFQ